VLLMASDRLGVPAARSRHQAVSGAAGAPGKKGLDLYGRAVAGGAHRGHRLLSSTSCRRLGRPGREVRAAGFRQLLRGAWSGCRGYAGWTAQLLPGSASGHLRAFSGDWFPAARWTISRGKAGAG
jgi:hypothetical protein